jgi:hypothetical protein
VNLDEARRCSGRRAADHGLRGRRGLPLQYGAVIASGLAIGTLFTLFVVPAVYILLAADHSATTVIKEPQGLDPTQLRTEHI